MSTGIAFDPSVVDGIDQESVERNESEFPVVQWHRGEAKMKKLGGMDYLGGFFISETQAPTDMTRFGWEKVTWERPNNDTDGFWARSLNLSVVRARQRWEVYNEQTKRRTMYAWSDYDEAAKAGRVSGRAHWLVLVKGMEEFGPLCITLRGMASLYFHNKRNNPKSAVGQFEATVIRAANDAVKKAGRSGLMPRRAFWLPVGASQNDAGDPVFIEVGSGSDTSQMVVPMALGLPEKAKDVDLSAYFVGPELLKKTSDIWQETEAWAKAWDEIEPGTDEDGGKADTAKAEQEAEEETESHIEALGL